MKKIAILTPTFNYYSGVDRVAQQKAEEFARKGHKVTVISLEAKIKPKGYKIIQLGISKSEFLTRIYHRLLPFFYLKNQHIKKLEGYDEVYSFIYPSDALAYQAKKRYKAKYVAWFSGIASGENLFEKIYMQIYKNFYYYYLRKADKIVCVSNFVKNRLLEENPNLDASKVTFKYNEIDKSRFNKNVRIKFKTKANQIRQKYGLQNKKVLLYIGRLATSKRVDMLIKIFKMKKEEYPEAKLLIVGKPTFKRYFRKLLRMADEDIIFTGFVKDEDIPAYYAVSNVYVTASSNEGYNIPAVEAQACGLPVIAFDIGAHNEVIKKGKGILVPEGDIEGFSKSLLRYTKSF